LFGRNFCHLHAIAVAEFGCKRRGRLCPLSRCPGRAQLGYGNSRRYHWLQAQPSRSARQQTIGDSSRDDIAKRRPIIEICLLLRSKTEASARETSRQRFADITPISERDSAIRDG
jgi:hypothetical protein